MSRESFEDECPGCRPVLFDPTTGDMVPETHPARVALELVWLKTSRLEREAFHRVTCLNSRAAADVAIVQGLAARIKKFVDATTAVSS